MLHEPCQWRKPSELPRLTPGLATLDRGLNLAESAAPEVSEPDRATTPSILESGEGLVEDGTLLDSAQYASLVHTGAVSAQPLEIPIDVYGIMQRANEISAIAQVHMRRDEQRMRKSQQQMSQRHGAPQRHGAHRRPKVARKKHKQ